MSTKVRKAKDDEGFIWCPICGELPLIWNITEREGKGAADWSAECIKSDDDGKLNHAVQAFADTYEELKTNWNRRA